MIPWWWVLVAILVMWVLLVAVALTVNGEARDEVVSAVLTIIMAPMLGVFWVMNRVGFGGRRKDER